MKVHACSVALATLMLLATRAPIVAQSPPSIPSTSSTVAGEITGRVVNATGKTPIGIATIDVTKPGTAVSVARGTTGADGTFRIQGIPAGRYNIRIRALGYTPRPLAPIEITSASLIIDVGIVALSASPVELKSLEVTGQRQEVELAPDRNTYVVRDMPTTRGGTALDVLRNVPSVDVDIDNVVSLRGNSGVVVQINGRPSPMKPAQLGNFLAQLPADIVERIEVVPNPSARDDPEGVAGIINLVLKQKPDAGKSGGITVAGGTTGLAQVGANLGYEREPLSLYGSYGFTRDRRPRTEAIYRENRYLNPITYLEETGTRTQVPLAHTMTGSADYKLSEQDEISSEVVFSTRRETESYLLLFRDLNAARAITGLSDRLTAATGEESSFESTLGYKHAFAEKGHRLSSELRYVRDAEGGPRSVTARTQTAAGIQIGASELEKQTSWEHPTEKSAKVDYVRPLSTSTRLETGYKGSSEGFHTTLDTRIFDIAQNSYLPDTTRISDFNYDQTVNAAYAMVSGQSGKLQLQGGVRAERAATQFHINGLNATYNNNYNSLFPSALVAYNVDDTHQVKLSYSTRIRRPDDTDQLDPTLRYADPLNVFRGNPYLKPEYIRAIELGVQRSADRMTLQVTPFYRHTLDAVRTLRTIDGAGVSTRTFANVATTDAYGTDATVALSGGRLSGFAGASVFRQVSDAANLGPGLSARTFGWTARTNTSFRFSSTTDLQALFSYQAPMTVEQGRNASRTRFSIAARQKLMNDQMSVTLRVIDPFNTSRESSTTIDPRFY
ncbi:MAG: TonB-dependent receptor, partial [Gemmatimonadales bacterium]